MSQQRIKFGYLFLTSARIPHLSLRDIVIDHFPGGPKRVTASEVMDGVRFNLGLDDRDSTTRH